MTFMSLRHSGVIMICIRLCLIHVFRRSLSFHQLIFFFFYSCHWISFKLVGVVNLQTRLLFVSVCSSISFVFPPTVGSNVFFCFFFLCCLDGTQFGLPGYHLTIVSPSTVSRSLFNLCLYLSVPSTSLEAYSALINLATPSHTPEKRTVS